MTLSTAERELVARAAALVRDKTILSPPELERDGAYCWSAMRSAAQLGLMGMRIPASKGGLGFTFAFQASLAEELARVDFGFALALMNSAGMAAKLVAEAHPAVARSLVPGLLTGAHVACTGLTELAAGSDFAAIETSATRIANGWLLDGSKAWVTNAAVARVVVVYAQTEQGSGARGIASFVVDTERRGFMHQAAFDLPLLNTFGLGGFGLENYEASDQEMLQPPGQAFKSALAGINGARTYVAAMACGMVAECLDIAQAYGEGRRSFGKALREHQGWRWPLAEAATDLAAARHLVQAACDRIDQGIDAQLEAAQAKLFATRMAERHLPALAQAMGAEGLRAEHPFGRHQFAARASNLVDGSSEMLRERIFSGLGRVKSH
ncbi:MAG: acyl-CoA dehydrogenase family protein [Burkholderiaceae bacterium]